MSYAPTELEEQRRRAEKAEANLALEVTARNAQFARARKAEAECAALRGALEKCVFWLRNIAEKQGIGFECLEGADAALATDAGTGWLSPAQVTALKEAVRGKFLKLVEAWVADDGYSDELVDRIRALDLSKLGR